ncbi:MAG: hypothetical protein KKD07_08770 [Candidatus Omnitrophica bacterium]|nr:hypothetical protein [Candidatus Omnitrophota bacterium]MBU1997152.1 hypothetical protein [Candidatus Omnitrophota bacterium]MBU4334518.1 hypothetical protein [Candidatus Omnitrophota bacterium]
MINKKINIKNVQLVLVYLFCGFSLYVPPIEAGVTSSGIKPFPGIPRYVAESSEGIISNSSYSGQKNDQEKLFKLLDSSHILIKVEQEQLVGMIVNLHTDDITILHEIASKISLKIDKDKKKLRRLVNNVDQLVNNRYSKVVARAREGDMKAAQEVLFSFEEGFEKNFIEIFECNRCDKVGNYKNIIKNNALFLIENDDFTSVPELWNEISLMIKVPYKRWNKKYNKLQKKLKDGEKDYQIYYESITFEETRFVKTFHAVKQLLKQIAETDAPDFVFHEWDDL